VAAIFAAENVMGPSYDDTLGQAGQPDPSTNAGNEAFG